MPSFAVHIKVVGPFTDLADGKKFRDAYSHRFVSASDPEAAEKRAVESLRQEPQFAQLRQIDGFFPPLIQVDEVRKAHWTERFFSNAALVFRPVKS